MKVSWKKIIVILIVLIISIFGFLTWFKYTYSMGIAEPFEVNSPLLEQKILIATQSSEFKDKVVDGLVERLKDRSIYLKVIDISSLPKIEDDDFTAIVVLHNWELQKPPEVIEQFLKQSKNTEKIVVLATSGGSDTSMEGIEGISGESIISEIPEKADQLMSKLEQLLK
ncbi:MAG: hypothetical protein JJE55_11390 [Flavobacteriaceae bacterium]|nr:hypothetical protein [Flavobacteriaceae bacterium]